MNTIYLRDLLKDTLYTNSNMKDQILLETYVLIGENIDVDNCYSYEREGKTIWSFRDSKHYKHVIKLNYNPGVASKELTVKFFWFENDKPRYDKPPITDEKVFNTHLRVFIKEVLPMLPDILKHTETSKLTLDATDTARYRLYRIAMHKLLDSDKYELIEEPSTNSLYIKLK